MKCNNCNKELTTLDLDSYNQATIYYRCNKCKKLQSFNLGNDINKSLPIKHYNLNIGKEAGYYKI